MGILELKRIRGWLATGKSGINESFPFDPIGMNSPSMAVKEVKNGRLAMIAFVGIVVQAIVYREVRNASPNPTRVDVKTAINYEFS
jgi:light-harvesting complex I chlorophyll a/b binding protein 5